MLALLLPACSSEVEETSDETITYTVSTAAELLEWASSVTSSQSPNCILAADIDMKDVEWTPVYPFYGTFDGQGHTISNLTVTTSSNYTYTGFISLLKNSGTVKDLALTNATVTGTDETFYGATGGIAGSVQNSASISGCSFSGTVTGKSYTGGIAGDAGGSGGITACSFSGTVTSESTSSSYGYAGGIAGYATSGGITACYSDADVTAYWYAGGIAGYAYTEITDCYSSGKVESTSSCAGGIAGSLRGSDVTACYSNADVTASQYAGGIAGYANVSARNTYRYITACYSSGNVKSTGSYAGGIVGYNSDYTLVGCYSTAEVSGSTASGGVVGYMDYGYGISDTTACYWSGSATSGVGSIYSSSSYTDNTTKVESDWSDAMSAMNTALSEGGYSYSYRINSGSDSESFPLVLE